MKCAGSKQYVVFLIVTFLACAHSSAQFLDDFNGTSIATDPRAINGWTFFTGDGSATMDFQQATCNFIDNETLFLKWLDTPLTQTFTKAGPDKVILKMEQSLDEGKSELILEVILTRK